jgi:hypothetical protein
MGDRLVTFARLGQMADDAHPDTLISENRLQSWKEIAAYLKRGVSTAQRWAQTEGLPVHRLPHAKAETVFAYRTEIDAWWRERSTIGRTAPGFESLAVLPFENAGGVQDAYLSDGITSRASPAESRLGASTTVPRFARCMRMLAARA